MTFPGAKRRHPFVTLPRHKRSHEVIRLKGKRRRDAAEYGGRFTNHLVLNDPGRPDLYNQWFDFYFPGTDRSTIWNASFVTARKAFWDKAHDIAHTRAGGMLTPEAREKNSKLEFVPAQRSSTGKILFYKLAEREEMRFEQFGGLADLKAWRHDVQCEVFEDILFVESNGTAFIYGIEFEDGYQEAGITYTYQVNSLADWAKKPDVQAAFPFVKSVPDGAGSKESKHAIKLTSQGWEAKGLD